MKMRGPSSARAEPRFTAVVVLPTRPFGFATAMIFIYKRATAVPPVGPTAFLPVGSAGETPACPTDKMSVLPRPDDVAGPRKRKLNFSDFRFRILAVDNVTAF